MRAALQRAERPGSVVLGWSRIHITDFLVELEAGPLGLDLALDALARLGELPAPAKVVLPTSGEPGLLIEIPNDPDPGRASKAAETILELTRGWLVDGIAPVTPGGPLATSLVEEALAGTGWSCERAGDGFRVLPPATVGATWLRVTPLADGGVRLAAAPGALRVAGARAAEAVRLFALEANARCRLARFTVVPGPAGVVGVGRDVVIPAGAPLDRWLVEGARALAAAHAETGEAFRALGTAAVAEAYLAARAPGRRGD